MPNDDPRTNAGAHRASLRGLRTFCLAARHESFSAAAEALSITASAVSHQVKSLESELGRPLFERGSRSLALTEYGRSLYAEIEPLIRRLDAAVGAHRSVTPRQALRISVQPFFASEVFVPLLTRFTAAHPEIDIRVDTSDETSERHPAGADVSIRLFRQPPPDLSSDLLFPMRLRPAGAPSLRDGLRIENGRIVSEFPLIVHETRPHAWRRWSESAGIRLPALAPVIRLDSMIAVARAAERGVGAALVPMPLSEAWFESGSLAALFDHELVSPDGYYLVARKQDLESGVIRTFREWTLQAFRTHR